MHDVITVHPATTTILLHILKNITFTMAEIDWNDVTRHLLACLMILFGNCELALALSF
jgi:hypothetical protein